MTGGYLHVADHSGPDRVGRARSIPRNSQNFFRAEMSKGFQMNEPAIVGLWSWSEIEAAAPPSASVKGVWSWREMEQLLDRLSSKAEG